MKRVLVSGSVLLVLLSVALPASAQRPMGPRAGGGPGMNPLAALLEEADSLDLSAEQRSAFEVARDSLAAANEPHLADLRAARQGGGAPGGMQAMRPVLERMRANNDRFVEQALAHLQPAQRTVAERMLARMAPRRPGGGGAGV